MLDLEKSIEHFIKQQDLSVPLSTAQGVKEVPFQRWFRFKEAFSPKFVVDVLQRSPIKVNSILDPFAGSGTTALTAQLLGIKPSTIEVNPFLADLVQSKLQNYDVNSLIADWMNVIRTVDTQEPNLELMFHFAPATLYNDGKTERWIFEKNVLYRIAQFRLAIESLESLKTKTLLKVLLGAILIPLSNVIVNGKGRRYRKNWQQNKPSASDVDVSFRDKVNDAIFDITKYSKRETFDYSLYHGDSRDVMSKVNASDLVLFSPPYPNTFDYTDIYNVELWVLGYLETSRDNINLRQSTLRSHVQTKVDVAAPPKSPLLLETLEKLNGVKHQLWNKNIPDMVGSYFYDIQTILSESARILPDGGMAVIVIGDSRYADIRVNTAQITKEIAKYVGLRFNDWVKIRVMKSSAQQGWAKELDETALFFVKT